MRPRGTTDVWMTVAAAAVLVVAGSTSVGILWLRPAPDPLAIACAVGVVLIAIAALAALAVARARPAADALRSLESAIDAVTRSGPLGVPPEDRTAGYTPGAPLGSLHESFERMRDVLRAREQDLRASVEQRDALLGAVSDAILTIDREGRTRGANEAALRLFGASRAGLIGSPFAALLAPRHCAEVRDELAGAERAAGSRREVEGVRLDGHHFPMELALAATRGPSGPFHAAVARDIEPRRRAERERSELHRKLVQASRTAGIAEVTSGVLHNIGNALTGVNISASLLAQKLERVDLSRLLRAADLLEPSASGRASPRPGAVPRYLRRLTASAETQRRALRAETAVILEGIQHVIHVIRQQQSLARSAAVSEPTDLGASIREAVAVHVAEHHGIEVRLEIEGLAPVVTDRHKLLQVLVNLVNNAKQALTGVEHAEKRLTVRLKRPRPGWIRIEVADNGAGIDRAHLARLFEYGFTTRPGGHGFGLHSSALLAEDLGGRLSCESAGTGYGAVFTLDFPDDQREAA